MMPLDFSISSSTCKHHSYNHLRDMSSTVLNMMAIALVCWVAPATPASLPPIQVHGSYLPYYAGQTFNRGSGPFMYPAIESPSVVSDSIARQRGLDFLMQLANLAAISTRVDTLEKTLTTNNEATIAALKDIKASITQVEGAAESATSELATVKETLETVETTVTDLTKPKSIGGLPTSCTDLAALGNINSGVYTIKKATSLATVYCDFTKATTEMGYEKTIGFIDAHSGAVAAHFLLGTSPTPDKDLLIFSDEVINAGNAMDATTGKFTAPVDGLYYFALTGIIDYGTKTSGKVEFSFVLRKNGNTAAEADASEANTEDNLKGSIHLETMLTLKTGDVMDVYSELTTGVSLDSKSAFMGLLLGEQVFPDDGTY